MTQNSVNIGLDLVTGLGTTIAGIATTVGTAGAGSAIGVGMIASGVGMIAKELAQVHQMSFTPPQAKGNLNAGDVITASATNTFFFYGMSIKDEYLKIIDKYFDMFGYKCHLVKQPNSNHRSRYWYTKTIDVNIKSSTVPLDDLNKIKECYNNGVTFWKDRTNFKNYTNSNDIV